MCLCTAKKLNLSSLEYRTEAIYNKKLIILSSGLNNYKDFNMKKPNTEYRLKEAAYKFIRIIQLSLSGISIDELILITGLDSSSVFTMLNYWASFGLIEKKFKLKDDGQEDIRFSFKDTSYAVVDVIPFKGHIIATATDLSGNILIVRELHGLDVSFIDFLNSITNKLDNLGRRTIAIGIERIYNEDSHSFYDIFYSHDDSIDGSIISKMRNTSTFFKLKNINKAINDGLTTDQDSILDLMYNLPRSEITLNSKDTISDYKNIWNILITYVLKRMDICVFSSTKEIVI